MKTVCVFATLTFANGDEFDVIEHGEFGEDIVGCVSASYFIRYCESMWKKSCNKYKITDVVIG